MDPNAPPSIPTEQTSPAIYAAALVKKLETFMSGNIPLPPDLDQGMVKDLIGILNEIVAQYAQFAQPTPSPGMQLSATTRNPMASLVFDPVNASTLDPKLVSGMDATAAQAFGAAAIQFDDMIHRRLAFVRDPRRAAYTSYLARQRHGPIDRAHGDDGLLASMGLTRILQDGPASVMESKFHYQKIALALSGGGARGDFQVGALRFIYDNLLGIPSLGVRARPDIVTGTSVGAINGTKLATGYDDAVDQLIQTWTSLQHNNDMWLQVLDIIALLNGILGRVLDAATTSAVYGGLIGWASPLPMGSIIGGLVGSIAGAVGGLSAAVLPALDQLDATPSLYNLDPIRQRLRGEEPYWSQTGPGLRGASIAAGQHPSGLTVLAARGYDDVCYIKLVKTTPDAIRTDTTDWYPLTPPAPNIQKIDSDPVIMGTGVWARNPLDRLYWWCAIPGNNPPQAPDANLIWQRYGDAPLRGHWDEEPVPPRVQFGTSPGTASNGLSGIDGQEFLFGNDRDAWVYYGAWTQLSQYVSLSSGIHGAIDHFGNGFAFARRWPDNKVLISGGNSPDRRYWGYLSGWRDFDLLGSSEITAVIGV